MVSLDSLLATLAASGVELIVVGALAAVAQGAPVTTHDLDIVPRRTPDNLARLVAVLVGELDARCRGQDAPILRPTVEILLGPGPSLLQTRLGPLDVLGTIEGGRDYDALLPRTRTIEISGHAVRVLELAMLVELERESSRDEDRLVLPILEVTRQRQAEPPRPPATDWRDHPLCAPRDAMPARFWGPERLDPAAWREFAARLDPAAEIAAIVAALGDARDVVDVGGGTGLITQAIARRGPVVVIEPAAEQRAHLPPGITARAGRAEALPLPDHAHDAALATWVLQYCDDPMRAVDELARVARRRVVIVQAAPGNELVEIYNREAAVAGLPPAHHGWLLAEAAERLAAAGFFVSLDRVAVAVRAGDARATAGMLARMHFAGHPRLADMIDATTPYVAARGGVLADDGVVLLGRR